MPSLLSRYAGKYIRLFLLLCALVLAAGAAGAEEVRLPITLDYPFIRSAFIRKAFTAPGEKAVVVNQGQGCSLVELWDLKVSADGSRIKLRTRIKVKAGLTLFGKCLDPVDWEGWLEAWQQVDVDAHAMRFMVRTAESQLLKENGEPAVVGNWVLKLVETHVHQYLNQLSINLKPPVDDLETQLPLFIRADQRPMVEKWLKSLRPLEVRVEPQAVKVIMSMQAELPPMRPEPQEKSPELTRRELAAFAKYWEAWDSYLVTQIMTLAGKRLTQDERDEILAAVLDARIGFVQAMDRPAQELAGGRDLVREQFIETWRRLGPILRRHLLPDPSASLFNYLAFLTAIDALTALDKMGPALGLDISREGLMRLARLVDKAGFYPELEYGYEVDGKLRKLLGFGPPLPVRGKRYDPEDLKPSTQSSLLDWLAPKAWAKEDAAQMGEAAHTGVMARVLEWAPPLKQGKAEYLKKVRRMLEEAARLALERGKLAGGWSEFLRELMLAAAWQESCWRQFIRKGGALVYLRSYNNSSVGIMQINERVWRGLYNIESLRWDTVYNGRAGGEILDMYLRRYALRKLKPHQKQNRVLVAQCVYAMYNGGPRQLWAFVKRQARGRLWLSDKLFAKKYEEVRRGDLSGPASCLAGGG
jgi:hypothetical protein